MNSQTYTGHYQKFHQSSYRLVRNDVIVFNLGNAPFENWDISRMYPSKTIALDSNKPLISALKVFFKSDVVTSVVTNNKYLWTICLGKEHMIYPISKDVKPDAKLHRYATPYFVENPKIIARYLHGKAHPAYDNVFYYKKSILYLDNHDLPYPGGFYFDECEPTSFFRLCFLSDEPIEYVFNLISEWQSRQAIINVSYMTMDVRARPKFIDFQPVSEPSFWESSIVSTGVIHRKLSSKKPEHLIQDIIISYYRDVKYQVRTHAFDYLGLVVEWPFHLTYEGARPPSITTRMENRQFVALSVNGNNPKRVVYVSRPYDRYVEYNHVPATVLWTPISFVFETFKPELPSVKKVALDSVVVGLIYRNTFYCLSKPLLEGNPVKEPMLNTEGLLSVGSVIEIQEDKNVSIRESFKYNDDFSLRRVSLKGIPLEVWCLTKSENMHPYPKNVQLPTLVQEWLDFFMRMRSNTFDADVSLVKLALTLSKHDICYNLVPMDDSTDVTKEPISLSDKEIKFYLNEKIIKFINDVRVTKTDKPVTENKICVVS